METKGKKVVNKCNEWKRSGEEGKANERREDGK